MFPILNVYYKEWFRNGTIRRFLQLLFFVILPVLIYITSILIPGSLMKKNILVLDLGGFVIFVVSAAYTFLYRMESEDLITDDFPINFLPVNISYVYLAQMLFIWVVLYAVLIVNVFSALFFIDAVEVSSAGDFAFSQMVNLLKPLLLGMPYIILSGVLLGGFVGSIGKKIADNFTGGMKKLATLVIYILIFVIFKNYFTMIFQFFAKEEIMEFGFLYSPVGFSLVLTNFNMDVFFPTQIAASILFNIMLFVSILFINGRQFIFLKDLDFTFDVKNREFSFLSPVWNLFIRRIFTPPVIVFVTIWFVLIILVAIFRDFMFLYVLLGFGVYIYVFIFMDRMFPSKDENYRHVLETIPFSVKHIEGVFLGAYYIFLLIPYFTSTYIMTTNIFSIMKDAFVPNTLSGFMLKYFVLFTISAIMPLIISANPYFLSSNDKGAKVTRGFVFTVLILGYMFLSNTVIAMAAYYQNADMRELISKMFWHKGYYVWKSFIYVIFLTAIAIHIRSIILISKTFKNRKSDSAIKSF